MRSMNLTVFLVKVVLCMSAEMSNDSRKLISTQLLDGYYNSNFLFSEGSYDI